MAIVFDPAKSRRNELERDLPFERAHDFDFATASFKTDLRKDYGEVRIRAFGFIDNRLHTLVFTERGEDVRIISLRRANAKELREYEANKG